MEGALIGAALIGAASMGEVSMEGALIGAASMRGASTGDAAMNGAWVDVTASLPRRHTAIRARVEPAFKIAIGVADHAAGMAERLVVVGIDLDIVAAPL